MNTSIITIGDELLNGDTLDSNSFWISEQLTEIGLPVYMHLSVGDDEESIKQALNFARSNSTIILLTGGLGPTNDDKTKDVLTTYLNDSLVISKEQRNKVNDYYLSRGRSIEEVTEKMINVPQTAEVILNQFGVAPALWFRHKKKHIIAMPGIPFEMKGLMSTKIIPRLTKLFPRTTIYNHYFNTAGKGETVLAKRIKKIEDNLPKEISISYLPSFSQVNIRVSAKGGLAKDTQKKLQSISDQIRPELQDVLFSEKRGDTLIQAISQLSQKQACTIAVAESCTGGNIAHQITSLPGSSAFFKGGIIAYSNESKQSILGVKTTTLQQFGAVSEQTVSEMVKGTLSQFTCDYAIATSGVAGPGGGTESKPVGTVCIAVGNREKISTKTYTFVRNREQNIQLATMMSLNMLYRFMKQKAE